ncbi:hypothetical protein H0I25_15260 [Cellulophaga sp. HaHa_2_95]|uniref:hypothetical protein n=1 Tax=Cellulophaga sp. HaHa_2_95 TaxID=2745558 RepID=UPI001C501A37|nr:hypothetical protein [Cellulophaga sp. HaHa_2_95]QXP55416.1 hypothetical protein H0I25_15260 [Cellulophaga sp. HaHa_2_95]
MKKAIQLLGMFSIVLFVSCSGSDGFDGRDGVDGLDGEVIVGETYEIDNIDFSASSNVVRFTFPQEIVNGDAVLVYRLEEIVDDLDVWEPLPTATIFFDGGGYLQYRFNYTIGDVDIIVESDDLTLADDEFMLNQIFRIIVVPSDLISSIDTSDINFVMAELGLDKNNIQTIDTNIQN